MFDGFIFSINTGRAGSGYLAAILGTARECVAFHEAYPNFAGDPIRIVNTFGPKNTLSLQSIKIEYIVNTVASESIYADTSHLFIKSWYQAAMQKLKNVRVIWLRRPTEAVVNSLMRLNSIPGRTVSGRNWYLRADYPYNHVKANPSMNDREVCEWYVKEIDARASQFRRDFPDVGLTDVWLEELNSEEKVHGLFDELGLTATSETNQVIGRRANVKPSKHIALSTRIERRVLRILHKTKILRKDQRIHIESDGIYD